MPDLVTIGQVLWSREDMIGKLEEFDALYKRRPIKDNSGGMLSAHMFLAWFALQWFKPKAIVESGVWRGQGTWFFENACPAAKLYCIDLNPDNIEYKSERAQYFNRDFSTLDWSFLPKDGTVLFFDDHQNAYERVKTAKWFGFKHLLFEDNYPALHGDCYSLKKAFMHAGFKAQPAPSASIRARIKQQAQAKLGISENAQEILPNGVDAAYLRQNLEIYYEFPPVFRSECTRWGDAWDEEIYPTPKPLLKVAEKEYQHGYQAEAMHYTWLCYACLK